MSYLAPAIGHDFLARGHVLNAGRKQIFTTGELYGRNDDDELKLVATASTILVPIGDPLPPT